MSRFLQMSLPILCLVFGVIAWTAAPARGSQPVLNEWCPVLPDEKADPAITTVYKGKTIAFCCDHCRAKFEADPEKYVGRLPQFAESHSEGTSVADEHASLEEPAHDPIGANGEATASAGGEQHGHEHSSDHEDDEHEPWLGRIHPVIVHFPLAGVPLAFLGFLVWMLTGREAFAKADALPLFVASIAAIAAVITGNIAHDAMRFSDTLHRIVEQHQFVATTVMVLCVLLSTLRLWRWKRLVGAWRWVYGGGLLIACGLLAVTGFLGGSLVFGPDHLRF